jgi:hypothetical protein
VTRERKSLLVCLVKSRSYSRVTNRRGMLHGYAATWALEALGCCEGLGHGTSLGRSLGLDKVWRGDRGVCGGSRWAKTARDRTGFHQVESVGSVTWGGGGGVGVSAGQLAREASVAAAVELVGQAGSEQVGRAARSHNLSEGHVDSIKERRLWDCLGLKVSSTATRRLSRDGLTAYIPTVLR